MNSFPSKVLSLLYSSLPLKFKVLFQSKCCSLQNPRSISTTSFTEQNGASSIALAVLLCMHSKVSRSHLPQQSSQIGTISSPYAKTALTVALTSFEALPGANPLQAIILLSNQLYNYYADLSLLSRCFQYSSFAHM